MNSAMLNFLHPNDEHFPIFQLKKVVPLQGIFKVFGG